MTDCGLLAIDSGGTKCDMLLIDTAGNELARAQGNCSDLPEVVNIAGVGRSPEMLRLVFGRLQQQCEVPAKLEVGSVYGRSAFSCVPELEQRLFRYEFISEFDAALALGGVDDGMMVLAGTGATIFAREPDGTQCGIDGLGPLLGDAGGAFYIGLALIRHLAHQEQLDPGHTPGWSELLRHLQIVAPPPVEIPPECDQRYFMPPELSALIHYMMRHFDRSRIASVSRLAEELARDGHQEAQTILFRAADALAANAVELAHRMNWPSEREFTVVGVGSVLNRGSFVWPRLKEKLAAAFPQARLLCPHRPQVDGQIMAMLRRRNQFDVLNHFIEGESVQW